MKFLKRENFLPYCLPDIADLQVDDVLATLKSGWLTKDDKDIEDRARVLLADEMNRKAWNRYSKEGAWKYDIEEAGYKYNMFDLQTSLGSSQLVRLDEMQDRIGLLDDEAIILLDNK